MIVEKAYWNMDATSTLGRERLWTHARLLMLTARFDGTIVATNPAWIDLLGWSQAELTGRSFFDLLHPDDRDRTIAEASVMMTDNKQVPKFENRYRTAGGEYRDIDWTAVSDGEFIHAIGRDNTAERKAAVDLAAAEEVMRQSQKMEAIGQLTGGVAHDFNNLLTVIRGSVDLLRRPNLSSERRERYINAIGETADRAAKLTNQLLAFARRQALRSELFDVGASVNDVGNIVRTLTGSRIDVEIVPPRQALFVQADRSQLDTAIVNMAINARDAMNGAGRLVVAVGAVSNIPARRGHPVVLGDYVAVTVSDEGSGIVGEHLERVFEPFFTTKGAGHGTGLGLSQVIGFAKQSGGDVTVETALGVGTTFTLYLPRASEGGEQRQSASPDVVGDGTGVCVLLVEDNVSVGDFAAGALRELGYDSILARDGQQALDELAKDCGRFHILFTDVVMPGMSGVELAQQVRLDHPHIPIVLTSGYSHVLAENGSFGFELLHKPYSIDQLSRVLHKAISWKVLKPEEAVKSQ